MTEFFILCSSFVGGLLLTDPFYNGALTKTPFAKFLIFAFGFGALLFHLLGRLATDPERTKTAFSEMVRDWWPALLLCTIVLGGSVYARNVEDIRESFLGLGLGMLYLPLMAVSVRSSAQAMPLMKGFIGVYGLMAVTMLGLLYGTDHLFHESIFLIVPLGAYFLTATKPRAWQVLLGLTLIIGCAYSVKNTTFLMILATLACCAGFALLRTLRAKKGLVAFLLVYVGTIIAVASAAGLVYAWWKIRSNLPSGNVDYRMEMYGIAWRLFLDSPLWGTLFSGSSVNYFTLYRVDVGTQYLPTHSDILDILAQGGVLGIGLWAATVWRIFAIGWDAAKHLARPSLDNERAWRWLFVLVLIQVNAIITYAVNPPLISPVHGYWIWGSAGVMWALHRHLVAPLPSRLRSAAFAGMRGNLYGRGPRRAWR